MYILTLSKEHDELPLWEARSLLGFNHGTICEKYLFLDKISQKDIKALDKHAYTRQALKVLFTCSFDGVLKGVKLYDFNKVVNGKYKVFYEGFDDDNLKSKINDEIWECLEKPKVDLLKPKVKICFVKTGDYIHCCLKLWENTDDFQARLPHKRKGPRPISLRPNLARCIVNLVGCRKGKIIDPMTGTSGFLIEALLCGLKVEGYDIKEDLLEISEMNFKDFMFDKKNYKLANKDFFKTSSKMKYVVTDLPYGKNTKAVDKKFYSDVLVKLDRILTERAVVVFPDWMKVESLFKKLKLKNIQLIKKFSYYVHGTMSREICIIEAI